jgi:hypothetical protein
LTLDQNVDLDQVGWVAPPIDARRPTAISEKPGGAENIEMRGGTYYGYDIHNGTSTIRFINFVSVKNSYFHDFTVIEGSDDAFTLGPGSYNNVCRKLTATGAHGNGLTDKGDHNKWFDCIAEDCDSDGWTPKCRYSVFYRCIARRNDGPGFGLYCRIDGSGDPVDLGEAIEHNKFYACESYENAAAGFSFNISSTSGEGGTIRYNYVEAIVYNNGSSGVRFRNKMPNSIVDNNVINILSYGNRGQLSSGGTSSLAGGLGVDASYPVTGITGSIVGYDNVPADVNISQATDSHITAYHPDGETPPVLKPGDASNSIAVADFNCSDQLNQWCMQAYCALPVCGDGSCGPYEDMCSCSQDCGTPPSNETSCMDGIDNDCDTYTDCYDSDCAGNPDCPSTETTCTDGVDNDFDGNVDCADADCSSDPACQCGNGICDPGENCDTCSQDCISKTGGKPSTRYCCGDGLCEGAEDSFNCAVDCGAPAFCGDGTCDSDEDRCSCESDCGLPPLTETACDDGKDEDCDGDTDCGDSDCDGNFACPDCGVKGDPCTTDEECCKTCNTGKGTCK